MAEHPAGVVDHARRIAPHIAVAVPQPLAVGAPGPGYGGWWSVYRWIPGDTATAGTAGDGFARDLAGFVTALRAMDTGGRTWDGRSRGGPLHTRDGEVRRALAASTTSSTPRASPGSGRGAGTPRVRPPRRVPGSSRWAAAGVRARTAPRRGPRRSAVSGQRSIICCRWAG